jgi:prepilin-type N-terminal cleavage/methylation domain-containing protein
MSATGEAAGGEGGFTLLEALVALAIFGLLSGLMFPAVAQGVAGAAFEQAASGLRADLAMARAQALRTGAPVELVVDDAGRGYGWTPGPQRELIADLALAPAGARVAFYSDGSSSGGVLSLQGARRAVRFDVGTVLGEVESAP